MKAPATASMPCGSNTRPTLGPLDLRQSNLSARTGAEEKAGLPVGSRPLDGPATRPLAPGRLKPQDLERVVPLHITRARNLSDPHRLQRVVRSDRRVTPAL